MSLRLSSWSFILSHSDAFVRQSLGVAIVLSFLSFPTPHAGLRTNSKPRDTFVTKHSTMAGRQEDEQKLHEEPSKRIYLVTGGSGMVGRAVQAVIRAEGRPADGIEEVRSSPPNSQRLFVGIFDSVGADARKKNRNSPRPLSTRVWPQEWVFVGSKDADLRCGSRILR